MVRLDKYLEFLKLNERNSKSPSVLDHEARTKGLNKASNDSITIEQI